MAFFLLGKIAPLRYSKTARLHMYHSLEEVFCGQQQPLVLLSAVQALFGRGQNKLRVTFVFMFHALTVFQNSATKGDNA